MAQYGTAESTLHLSLSFVLMEGIITAVRSSHPCKPSFWQWVSYTRYLGKDRRLCTEIFGSSLQGAVHLSCTQFLTHFLSFDIFYFYTFYFFPSRTCFSSNLKLPSTGPHDDPAFPLPPAPHFVPALSPVLLSLKTSFLNSLFFLTKWPFLISPGNLLSLASPPSQIFVVDLSGPLSQFFIQKSSPGIISPHQDLSFPTLCSIVCLMCPLHKSQEFAGKATELTWGGSLIPVLIAKVCAVCTAGYFHVSLYMSRAK